MSPWPDARPRDIRGVNSGLIRLIRVGEIPLQRRRNREPLGERAKALEKFGSFLRRHRESDAQPSRIGDQIRPDENDPIPDGPQPPFKPARREHGVPNPLNRL